MKNIFDYSTDVNINSDELDIEWIKQPSLFMRYQEELVMREKIKTKAKENIEIIEAELDKEIRSLMTENKVKVTESLIKAEITRNEKRKKAVDDCIEKTYNYNIINGAVKALDHKKKALEKLTELYIAGYFSEPKTNSSITEEKIYDNISKKIRKGINKQ